MYIDLEQSMNQTATNVDTGCTVGFEHVYQDSTLSVMPRQLALYHMIICLHFPAEIPVGGFKIKHNSSMWVYTISTIEKAKRLPPFQQVLDDKERMFTYVQSDQQLYKKLCSLFSGVDPNTHRSDESKIRTLTLCMWFFVHVHERMGAQWLRNKTPMVMQAIPEFIRPQAFC